MIPDEAGHPHDGLLPWLRLDRSLETSADPGSARILRADGNRKHISMLGFRDRERAGSVLLEFIHFEDPIRHRSVAPASSR